MNPISVPRPRRGRESLRAYFRRLEARLAELQDKPDRTAAEDREMWSMWVESAHQRPTMLPRPPRGVRK